MKVLSKVKGDLEFNKGLTSLVDVLKNIAVAQFRSLEHKIKSFEELILSVEGFFEFIDVGRIAHPFLKPVNKRQIVVAVTSDTGLLGGLNMRVINTAIEELRKIPGKLVVLGERGKISAQEIDIPFTSFEGIGIDEEERYYQATQLRNYIIGSFFKESMGFVKAVYPRPLSLTVQCVETVSFLPYLPAKKYSFAEEGIPDIITESKPGDVAEYLIDLWMGEKLFELLGLSRLAEFGARFVHLQGSSQKLSDLSKKLKLEYFRIMHELIDRNMRDLFAARLLYASKG